MATALTNKLSIYLIKQRYSSSEDIFSYPEKLTSEDIDNNGEHVGKLYYKNSHVSEPAWVKRFLAPSFDNNINNQSNNADSESKIFTANPSAVLLTTVNDRTFALTFGYGRTLLKPGIYEERFGLRTILNIINPDSLRSINRRNLSSSQKISQEQLAKNGTVADFGVDIEQDLVQGVTAKTGEQYRHFGQTVTGKDALSLSVKVNISNTKKFLEECYARYNSDDYKKDFGWIDQVLEVRDPQHLEMLDNELIKQIKASDKNSDFDKIWMAVPEVVDWEKVAGFIFEGESFGDDLDLQNI